MLLMIECVPLLRCSLLVYYNVREDACAVVRASFMTLLTGKQVLTGGVQVCVLMGMGVTELF
jgi:hypothetical protein